MNNGLFDPPPGFTESAVGVVVYSPQYPLLKMGVLGALLSNAEFWRDAEILFVKKSAGLNQHAGQIAFPGGKKEPGETWPTCVVRELFEETALKVPVEAVFASSLPPSLTGTSRFWIYPYLICADEGMRRFTLCPDLGEISEVFWIKWSQLQSSKVNSTLMVGAWERMQNLGLSADYLATLNQFFPQHTFFDYEIPKGKIWGATAFILNMLEKQILSS